MRESSTRDLIRSAHHRLVCAALTVLAVVASQGCSEEPPTAPVIPPAPPVGWIVVVATVTGQDIDVDGFAVSVDGGTPRPAAPGVALLFSNIAPGPHTVSVDGVASNCALRDLNPQTAAVVAREVTAVVFNVTCSAYTTGGIRVRVLTPGFNSFAADIGQGAVASAADGTVLFANLKPDVYAVQLHINQQGCLLNEPNPQSQTVIAGRITDVYFTLACPSGSLLVNVTTSGTNQALGYTVNIVHVNDAYCYMYTCQSRNVGPTGQARFDGLSLLDYFVTLQRVPANCTASPGLHTVHVPVERVIQVAFAVSCR